MVCPSLLERERRLLDEWVRLIAERAAAQVELTGPLTHRISQIEAQLQDEQRSLAARHKASRDSAVALFQTRLDQAKGVFEAATQTCESETRAEMRRVNEEYEAVETSARRTLRDSQFMASTLYEARKAELVKRLAALEQSAAGEERAIGARWDELGRLLTLYRVKFARPPTGSPTAAVPAPSQQAVAEVVKSADAALERLRRASVSRSTAIGISLVLVLLVWLVLGGLVAQRARWEALAPAIAAGIAGIAVGAAGFAGLRWHTRTRVTTATKPVVDALAEAEAQRVAWRRAGRRALRRQSSCDKNEKQQSRAAAKETFDGVMREARQRHDAQRRDVQVRRTQCRQELAQRQESEVLRLQSDHALRLEQIDAQYHRHGHEAQQRCDRDLAAARGARDTFARETARRWERGHDRVIAEVDQIHQECAASFPPWQEVADHWAPPRSVAWGVRLGQWRVGPSEIAELLNKPAADPLAATLVDSAPAAARIEAADLDGLPTLVLPAVLEFANHASLWIDAPRAESARAAACLRAVMLRVLTTVPPALLRFTIIDPLRLGQNFAAFMHLDDYEESLVGGRIWTEPAQIEERLARLAAQMETIIQHYLRNEFDALADYNAQAGDVAEPFRYLVIANLPANLTEAAARRLSTILSAGARCGVHTLIAHDIDQPLPSGAKPSELSPRAPRVRYAQGRWSWDVDVFDQLPLELDLPPENGLLTRILQRVGEGARGANRVEIPFDRFAPPFDQWWTLDSRQRLRVPLGTAGANKCQFLELGQGTAQQAIVVGKTGSGKSTLLHTLITGAALAYPPDELEFYLIDFKKGVEFKAYAEYRLPHARVIGIESDREFGLSALARLDSELHRRGELFRAAGVQDIAAFRQADGDSDHRLPRILLVVDEFQEFFVRDDKLAQDVALLLDRLVRQGRAFGIHVLLGSQTLGGAYSLPRSTLGQMAVRIALACSETDAPLILGETNTAAQFLARPGSAIYNDSSGLVDANRPFQVSWLSESDRVKYLTRLAERAARDAPGALPPAIVFEGNQPADMSQNALLSAFADSSQAGTGGDLTVWLGDPVSIKAPTAVSLRRQNGHNLLLVGQQPDSAEAIATAAMIGLSLQHGSAEARSRESASSETVRVVLFDGTLAEPRDESRLSHIAQRLCLPLSAAGPRGAAALMNELTAELERRVQVTTSSTAPWLVVVYDLQRFRDLRRAEDEFSFARSEAGAASPALQLARLLRDGPLVGIHALVWCDSWNSLKRSFDRQSLGEFDLRVLFQMSATDSSSLIDSPAAAHLGAHRALLYDEQRGVLEKFRPYGPPKDAWLDDLALRLQPPRQLRSANNTSEPPALSRRSGNAREFC